MSKDYDGYANVHAHACDGCYNCNVDKEEGLVEDTPLEESCKMLIHKVFFLSILNIYPLTSWLYPLFFYLFIAYPFP